MNQEEVVAHLERKTQKYEHKIRDLIEAYKTIQKEKDVLQETIKSLSNTKVSNSDDNCEEVVALKNQVTKLSQTISTLNEDKKKMERRFQDDKKITREENEKEKGRLLSKVNSTNSKLEQFKIENRNYRTELEKLKSSIHSLSLSKLEYDEEIRRLTKTVSDQKMTIDNLTYQLRDYRAVKDELEGQVVSASVSNEDRVTQLESTVSELSKTIGELQTENRHNLDTISKQQDRLKHYQYELQQQPIKSPHSRARTQSETPDILQVLSASDRCTNADQSERSIQQIVDQMSLLRVQLTKLDPNLDIVSVISPGTSRSIKSANQQNEECENAECVELRSKYEEMMMQKIQETTTTGSSKEANQLKERVSELNQELYSMEMVSSQNIKMLKDTILKNECSHKQEINQLKHENSRIVSDIQSELTKHRNRTINLLSEKDLEITHVSKQLENAQLELRLRHHGNEDDKVSVLPSNSVTKENNDDSWYDIPVNIDQSCPLYQCCETKARLEKEVRRLHQYKRQLESQMHKLHADLEYSKADFSTQLQLAKQQQTGKNHCHINKKRNSQPGNSDDSQITHQDTAECVATINMEYLKNVFRTYLQTDETEARRLMAKAIGRVLDFTDSEMMNIDKTKHFRF